MTDMWLRVVLFDCDRPGEPETLDYMQASIKDALRRLRTQGAFKGGHWGHDPEAGTLAAVTHWATRDGIRAADAELQALAEDRRAHGVHPRSVTNLCLVTAPKAWDQADWDAVVQARTDTWLRVALYRPQSPDSSDALDYLRTSTTQAIDMLETRPGFRIGYWGHDPVEGTMAAVTYWDSLEAIKAAGPDLERLHRDRAEHGITTEVIANLNLFPMPVIEQGEPQGYVSAQGPRG